MPLPTPAPDVVQAGLLFDFYGELLTLKQQEVFRLYYHENLSLGEIATLQNVSRQAVHYLLRHALEDLTRLERCVGGVERFRRYQAWYGRMQDFWQRLVRDVPAAQTKENDWQAMMRELDGIQSPPSLREKD